MAARALSSRAGRYLATGATAMNDSSIAAEDTSVIARFEVHRRAYLAPDGTPGGVMPAWASDASALIPLYRAMVLVRAFDLKAV